MFFFELLKQLSAKLGDMDRMFDAYSMLVNRVTEHVRSTVARDPADADTAIFFSISNCQEGLRGISFGNFLIKQVVDELQAELPQIKTFATRDEQEVAGKRKLADLHAKVVGSGIIKEVLKAQADFLEVMNSVSQRIEQEALSRLGGSTQNIGGR